jgi:hypothetical protein
MLMREWRMASPGASTSASRRFYLAVHADKGKHETDCVAVSPIIRSDEAEERQKNKSTAFSDGREFFNGLTFD